MTDQTRADVLRRAILALVSSDAATLGDLMTDDVTVVSPILETSSLAELTDGLDDRDDQTFTDVAVDVTDLTISGDRGYAEWVASATHSDVLVIDDDFVVEATGGPLSLHGVMVADFAGDKIAKLRQYWNEAELLDGLGLLPAE